MHSCSVWTMSGPPFVSGPLAGAQAAIEVSRSLGCTSIKCVHLHVCIGVVCDLSAVTISACVPPTPSSQGWGYHIGDEGKTSASKLPSVTAPRREEGQTPALSARRTNTPAQQPCGRKLHRWEWDLPVPATGEDREWTCLQLGRTASACLPQDKVPEWKCQPLDIRFWQERLPLRGESCCHRGEKSHWCWVYAYLSLGKKGSKVES